MKKTIFILVALLIINSGFAKEYKTGLTTVRSMQLGKVLADNPERSMVNIGNWGYWMRDNGESSFSPSGNSGGFYPRGTAAAIYLDGVLVGGYQGGNLKVSGQIYRNGTERGYILNGEHMTQSKDPRVRLYRIRKDWATLTRNQVRQDAAELNETTAGLVTDAQIDAVIAQYVTDWNEWPTELGAPFYDLNGNGTYEPAEGETPGIANADQVIWLVITDANATTTRDLYGTDPIGIEQQMTMWAYNQPGAGLGQIIFKQIRLINKGDGDLTDAYISLWSDPDVGDSANDLVGVDVPASLMYAYNGEVHDDQYDDFGLAPPAAGYDFFAGPVVESPGDVAIFDLKERPGYKNLPASSFGYFVAGGVYGDPGPYGQVEAAREYYNLMRGFAPIDDLNNPTPWLDSAGNPTLFPFNGDPVTGIGEVDSSPADRRMLINSGPFTLAEGDTQDIVVAVVGGLGDNNLSSITAMKNTDVLAQKLFDDLFKSVPSAPAGPVVNAFSMDGNIVLDWGSDLTTVNATELPIIAGYEFQGYNIYQLPSATASKDQARLIATFDKVDGVKTINGNVFVAEYGQTVNIPVQYGQDLGIKRSIQIERDHLTGTPLYPGSEYFFSVTAYNYNEAPDLIEDLALETPLTPALVKLSPAPLDTEFGASYGDALETTHSAGVSDGKLNITVVDPNQLTGDDYEVFFMEEEYFRDVDGVWKSTNTAGKEALNKILDCTGSMITVSALASANVGTYDLTFNFDMHCGSNWVDGIMLDFPDNVVINSWEALGENSDGGQNCANMEGTLGAGNVLTWGNDLRSAWGCITGNLHWVVNIQPADFPLNVDYTVYDDQYDGTLVDAVGTATTAELGYDYKTIVGWYGRNTTTNTIVTPHTTVQSGVAEENITEGLLVPAHTAGANENPSADGLLFAVDGPPLTFKSVAEIAYGGTTLDAPDGVWHSLNSNRTYFVSAGGGSGDYDRLGRYIQYAAPRDFEMRFTDGPNYAVSGFTTQNIMGVPFEVWDIGIATPDDPSDDKRMMPFIYENVERDYFGYDGDVDPYFGGAYTASDWVYWFDFNDPVNGYNDFAAAAEAGGGPGNTISPDRFGYGVNFYGGFVYPIARMLICDFDLAASGGVVPSGTTFRVVTNKPNTLDDKFSFTAPANTISDALAKEAVEMVNVFPNPYYANNSQEINRFDNFVTFNHMPQKANIKIFSIDGKIVRELDKDTDSQYFQWDLRNHTNLPVASGVYLAHIDMDVDDQKLGSKVLKLFIVQSNQVVKYY